VFLIMLSSQDLYAQKNIDVKEQTVNMSQGENNGYSIFIKDAQRKEGDKIAKEILKEVTKKPEIEKVNKNEFKVNDIKIDGVSDQPVDVYILLDEQKDGILVTGFFDLGTGYLSSSNYPENSFGGVNFMKKIGLRTEKIRLAILVEEGNDVMKNMIREQETLISEQAKLDALIADCEAKIE